MTTILNTVPLREQAIDTASIGSTIYWMGIPHQVCITEDGRKIAYPYVREQTAQAA
jgi:hypothetical protein